MTFIIPFNLFLLFIIFLYLNEGSIRSAFSKAFVTILFLVAVSTELLSIFDSLHFTAIFIFWTFSFLALLWFSARKGFGEVIRPLIKIMEKGLDLSWIDWVGIGFVSFILSLTLLIAILAPPNNFDSMTYHMARVAEWIQHENIRFYPTAIPRQNHAMPLAEFAILHLQLLSKSDQYANLVQWMSFLISILVASLIAKELNASRSGQVVAGVLVATLPMAILQSSSTQNDLVVGSLCLIFAYFLIRVVRRSSFPDTLFASLSMGLALLTKGTAYLYCAGIGLGIGGSALIFPERGRKERELFVIFTTIILGALIINSGLYLRNTNLYGYPLSTANSRITVDRISLGNIVANLIRNSVIHLATPLPSWNSGLTKMVSGTLGQLANHPTSTFGEEEFAITYLISDDYSGNLIHFLTLIFTLLVVFWNRKEQYKMIFRYFGGFFLAVLFYSVAIRWQPWASRLHTPLFLIGMPLIAQTIDRIKFSTVFASILILIVFVYSLPFLFLNKTRPLMPFFEENQEILTKRVKKFFSDRPKRYEQFSSLLSPFFQDRSVLHTERRKLYFMNNFNCYSDYIEAMREVGKQEADVVGLYLGSNDWEYPIWVLSDKHAEKKKPLFIHIGVENETKALIEDPYLMPDYIIATKALPKDVEFLEEYRVLRRSEYVDLLIRE